MSRPPDELKAGAARLRIRQAGGPVTRRSDPAARPHDSARPDAARPDAARVWRRISELQRRAATCRDRQRLGLLIVNDPGRLFAVRQAVLWRIDATRQARLQAVSGLSKLPGDTPNALFLAALGQHVLKAITARVERSDGPSASHAPAEGYDLDADLPALPAPLAAERAEYLAGPVRVVVLDDENGRPLAIVAFHFDAAAAGRRVSGRSVPGHSVPGRSVLQVLGLLQPVWSRCWQALLHTRRPADEDADGPADGRASGPASRHAAGRGKAWAALRPAWPALLALLLLAALAWPIRLTVLAPAEVIALDAVVVAAPQDGVLARFSVVPNQPVRADQPLFRLDDTTLRNRREVARQQWQVARAEVLAASQKAFAQDASRAGLAALEGRVAERAAELAWIEEQLDRIEVRSPADGVAIFSDPNDWIGRPVVTGERILQVGSPAAAGLLIWLSVNDALAIEPGARVRLHLPTEPLAAREARLFQTSYQAEASPDGIVSYRLRARFESPGPAIAAPRIGLRGTARIEGEQVRLGYYLFRRPIAALREWTGW